MTAVSKGLATEAEFLSLPESNQHIELVDGEVIRAPSPTLRHQEILGRVYEALRTWVRAQKIDTTVVQAPLDVRFAPGRILQPDVMAFLPALRANTELPVTRIPNLVIEVVSTNRTYDRVAKRAIYGVAGVLEYWLVDIINDHVEVCFADGLASSRIEIADVASPLLAHFKLDVATLFAQS
jgi:Uma2 family endonuclease